VVSAIPRRLVEKAKQNLDAKFTFSPENSFFPAITFNKCEPSENEE